MTRPHGTVAGVAFLAKRWRTFFVVALFGIATLINLLLTIKCRGGETAVSLKKTYKITNGKPWSPFHWNNTADKRASMINRPGSQITSFPPSRWPKRIISTDNPRIDGYVRSTSRVTTPNRTIYEPKDVVYSNAIMNRRSPQIDSIPVSPNKTSEDCVPMKEWHLTSYPTCNTMHETNILSGPINMLAEGTVRSTWKIANYNAREKSQEIILKTLK